jgi:hypothetical protein
MNDTNSSKNIGELFNYLGFNLLVNYVYHKSQMLVE